MKLTFLSHSRKYIELVSNCSIIGSATLFILQMFNITTIRFYFIPIPALAVICYLLLYFIPKSYEYIKNELLKKELKDDEIDEIITLMTDKKTERTTAIDIDQQTERTEPSLYMDNDGHKYERRF